MKLYELIRQYKDELLDQWMNTVREQIAGAEHLETLALQNDMPDLLDDIVTSLDESTPKTITHESIDHGKIRATVENYTLSQVIREYCLLLKVVLYFADERTQVQPKERDTIIYAVTNSIEQASEAFFQLRKEEDHNAKQAAEALVEELRREGELREEFIGTLTHDLRNPLANTFSLVELMRDRVPQEPLFDKLLNAMQHSLTQADTLIRNLLDANLIKSGSPLPIKPKFCDLMPEVRDSVESFSTEHKGGIVLDCSQPSIMGEYDCSYLRRAVDNLIKNAMKYGAPKGTITVGCEPDSDGYMMLSVHNEGDPIPEDQQTKIFSRNYRIEEKRGNQGWGLGLALVKGVVEAHGGKVEVESRENQGTTFTLKIPRATSR